MEELLEAVYRVMEDSGRALGRETVKGAGQKGKNHILWSRRLGAIVCVCQSIVPIQMNNYGSAPLYRAKQEVLKSVESLTEFNQFQIVFLQRLTRSDGKRTPVCRRQKTNVEREILFENMPGDGSTAHFPALKQGLAMSPEVLFFLTDADDPMLSMQQLLDLQRRAELAGTNDSHDTIQYWSRVERRKLDSSFGGDESRHLQVH